MWSENQLMSEMGQEFRAAMKPPMRRRQPTENHVLYVQILLCILIGCAFFLMRRYAPELYDKTNADLQQFYRYDLSEEEKLIRYAMKRLDAWKETVYASAQADHTLTECSLSRKKAPAGSSLEYYMPTVGLGNPVKLMSITSRYGWRNDPFTGKNSFHTGVDIAAEQGTSIYPALSGYVRLSGYNSSYGNHLRIMHSDGTETLYAHMQYLFVAQGENVQQTTPLGTVGRTGNTTGPHLHFELIHDDIRYDPAQALQL